MAKNGLYATLNRKFLLGANKLFMVPSETLGQKWQVFATFDDQNRYKNSMDGRTCPQA
jgi:hypothetical protein